MSINVMATSIHYVVIIIDHHGLRVLLSAAFDQMFLVQMLFYRNQKVIANINVNHGDDGDAYEDIWRKKKDVTVI